MSARSCNVLATRLAQAIVSSIPEVSSAQCVLVSRIGAPGSEPALIHLKLATQDGIPVDRVSSQAEELARDQLGRISKSISELVAGHMPVF